MWIVIHFPANAGRIYYGPFTTREEARLWIRNQKPGLGFQMVQLLKP